MQFLMMLLNPRALISMGAFGLIFLAVYIGPQLGLSWVLIAIIAGAIIVIWVLVLVIVKLSKRKAADDLEESLNRQAETQIHSARPGREGEIEKLRENLNDAVDALKTSRVGKSGGRSALYVLPWYMIIGPPASGKTTLLTNSGLNFPYMDKTQGRASVKGVGGTRNCDWWFADEAILLDTAGRYTLPVEQDDSKEWLEFLKLIRDKRGKKPINGLMVAVSIKDLLEGGIDSVEDHAAKIRTRIDELIDTLGISFPIYVVFTKCDLIRGFVEFYGDLSKAERAEVWGTTLPRDEVARRPAVELFNERVEELAGSLRSARIPRLAQEVGADKRPDILFFPLQFEALKSRLSTFIELLFKENPYQERPIFRGFYFTSGTQEGRPIDQVINAMLSGFGLDKTGEGMYLEPTQTKSYFIENAFSKVIFPDRHIAGPSAEQERKKRKTRVRMFMAGSLGLITLFIAMFWLSTLNSRLLNQVRSLGDQAAAIAEERRQELSLADVRVLDRYRGKLQEMDRKGTGVSKALLLGTYQADAASDEARELYLKVVCRAVMAPAAPSLVRNLRTNADSLRVGFEEYYRWYRTWQIVLDPGERLKERDAPAVGTQLAAFWEPSTRIETDKEEEEFRTLLRRQLEYACRYPTELAIACPPGSDDDVLDDRARAALRNYWNADIIYPALADQTAEVQDISVASLVGTDKGISGSTAVPGNYTMDAWNGPVKGFLDRIDGYRDDWALQRAFRTEPPSQRGFLVAKYADDYLHHWLTFLEHVDVTKRDEQETKVFLERASKENSPLLQLLRTVAQNTSFDGATDPNLVRIEDSFVALQEFFTRPGGNLVNRVLRKSENDQPLYQEYLEKVTAISEGYADIAESRRPAESAPIRDLNAWVDIHIPQDPSNPVASELARLLRFPAITVTGAASAGKSAGLEEGWGQVYREYRESLSGRYPLGSGSEVSLADFERFFSPGGTFWTFYQENLSGIVTPDGQAVEGSGVKISGGFLECLRRAYRIRRAVFGDGGRAGFRFSLRPARPPERPSAIQVNSVRFSMGGESDLYQMGQRAWTEYSWPGGSQESGASLRLDAGGTSVNNLEFTGAWGFFRLLDKADIQGSGTSVSLAWTLGSSDGDIVMTYDVRGLSAIHPIQRGFFRINVPSRVTAGE